MIDIKFHYNGSEITVLEEESTYKDSLLICKNLNSTLINLRNVNISMFSNKFHEHTQNSLSDLFRVKSLRTEKQCYGLVNYKLETLDVNNLVYDICSDNDYFNNTFPSICQSSINENELTTAIINNTLSTKENSNGVSSGTIVGTAVGVFVGILFLLVIFAIWRNRRSRKTPLSDLQIDATRKILKLQYKKVRLF